MDARGYEFYLRVLKVYFQFVISHAKLYINAEISLQN